MRLLSLLLACSASYSCRAILGIEDPPQGDDDSEQGGAGGEDPGVGGTTRGGTGGTDAGGTSSGASGEGGSSTGTGGDSGDAGQGGSAGTGGPSPDGTACSNDTACASGFCRDGVCCETECDGSCQACAEVFTGQPDGSCELAASGLDPHDDCAEAAPDTCGNDGSCDGAGECRKYGPNQVCAVAGCSSSVFQPERTCDGQGECAPAAEIDCGEHPCTTTGCEAPCMGDDDCDSQSYCSSTMLCRAKKTDGTMCDAGNECRSTNCVDGVCCDDACTGNCMACTEAKTGQASGRCLAVPTGQDPDNECSAETGNACGRDGTCNGGGSCRVQSSGTTCGTATCSGETLTPAGSCDGESGCTPSSARACPGGLRCASATACLTRCSTNTDCAAGNYCSAEACLPKKGTGVSCGGAGECVSGACVDSVCCGSACTLACQGCSNAATGRPNGTCGQRTASMTTACPTTTPTACFDLRTSTTNCGTCGTTCPGTPNISGTAPACLGGACASNCTNADRQLCYGDTASCVQSVWTFAGGVQGTWNNTNETSSEVATNHGRTDNFSLRLYASFNTTYPAEAFTYFCDSVSGPGGTINVRGKRASAYVYVQATSYGSYAARCRIIAYKQDYTPINLPWTSTPALNTWVQLTVSFGDQDLSIAQLGVMCDLPPSWNDGSDDLERWYIDDIRITN